jgi:uncharacterized protein YjbJ (UPF0337 family)
MISQQELQGSWNQIKGQVKERWGQLTDRDLASVQGSVENLVGIIQEKAGVARHEAEKFIEQAYSQSCQTARHMSETAQAYMRDASDSISNSYDDLSDRLQRGYADTKQMVQRSPAESVAVAFGAGILTGIVAALLLRSPR